jgi:uncharacterized protein (DUF433 family)
MKADTVQIVDCGRGPQLSTSRITVQDLVPYFLEKSSYAEIQEAMPTLSVEEIRVVKRYVQDHYEEVMNQDRRIRERAAARRKPLEQEEKERKERRERLDKVRQMIGRKPPERNGDQASR